MKILEISVCRNNVPWGLILPTKPYILEIFSISHYLESASSSVIKPWIQARICPDNCTILFEFRFRFFWFQMTKIQPFWRLPCVSFCLQGICNFSRTKVPRNSNRHILLKDKAWLKRNGIFIIPYWKLTRSWRVKGDEDYIFVLTFEHKQTIKNLI